MKLNPLARVRARWSCGSFCITIHGTITKTLRAIYENGVLRPLEPLDLPEHQSVDLVLTPSSFASHNGEPWLDIECLDLYAHEADASITLEEVRQALAKIPGSLTPDFIAERDET